MSVHWLRFFPADYVMATSHLPLNVKGAYMDLICHYAKFGSLPTLDTHLAEILHLKLGDWLREYKPRLEPLFSDGWKDDRLERELERALSKCEQAKNAAKKRWNGKQDNADAHADAYADASNPHMPSRTRSRFGSAKDEFTAEAKPERWWEMDDDDDDPLAKPIVF